VDSHSTRYRSWGAGQDRYYDPTSGRFTQEDPIGLAGGINLYGFGDGDPVNFSGPYGLCPPEDDEEDCATQYWAERYNNSDTFLGKLGNGAMGSLAACGESLSCGLVLDVASLGATAVERRVGREVLKTVVERAAVRGGSRLPQRRDGLPTANWRSGSLRSRAGYPSHAEWVLVAGSRGQMWSRAAGEFWS
jgi:uncharacterized protein RhaS with RHS repeats